MNRTSHRLLTLCAIVTAACTASVRQPIVHAPRDVGAQTLALPGLKVHQRSGALYILENWGLEGDSVLTGAGTRYGPMRDVISTGAVRIPVDSIALLETSGKQSVTSFGIGLINTWTVAWGLLTLSCVADPKSCFGSCPTFYLDDVTTNRPLAEGFSSSIARALEASDIDDLGQRRPGGARVDIRMTNEAWETHAVRQVRLHAVPVREGAQVFATPHGTFHEVRWTGAARTCAASGGDCRAALAARDTIEWRDVANENDLAAPDTITLAFPARSGRVGLVLAARQSFVSTFVLYQTMAYLGRNAGTWLANLERGDSTAIKPLAAVNALIGEIAISTQAAGGAWRDVARYAEAGPIATDAQLISLGNVDGTDSIRVRLVFAKGNWRIGYAALADIGDVVSASVLDPVTARKLGRNGADVRAQLVDPDRYLYSFPDDEFRFTYQLPRTFASYALFIEARGYYYEWMRGEWLAEENPAMAALLLTDPRTALRRLAPQYKSREAHYEQSFWNSRFGAR